MHVSRPECLNPNPNPLKRCDCIVLVRLYFLCDRLQAPRFQSAVLQRLTPNFEEVRSFGHWDRSDKMLCVALELIATELPERSQIDPLKGQIYCYAAENLSRLQECKQFRKPIDKGEIAKELCLRAGDPYALRSTAELVSYTPWYE